MSKAQEKKRSQIKLARIEIVGKMYKRGYSYREIRNEVMARLDLPSYSLNTVHNDINFLLNEWRAERLDNVDDLIQLELGRIDYAIKELWEQWDKSKERDVKRQRKKRASKDDSYGGSDYEERCEMDEPHYGNPVYIAEIRQQQMERRRLLGLYSPEKKEIRMDTTSASREELEAELRRLERLEDE